VATRREELGAAARWYDDRLGAAAAEQVLAELSESILLIAELPEAWPLSKFHPRVRARYLRRLRYATFYAVSDDLITVIAIAHTSRRPGYWLDQVP
jgi:plasmid stabilization system protein ParE